jgi:DNA-binding response OmpR family regulator
MQAQQVSKASRTRCPWLVVADLRDRPFFADLFHAEGLGFAFSGPPLRRSLARFDRGLVVLVAPFAGKADIEAVALWRNSPRGRRAALLSPHEAIDTRLKAMELGFDDAIDLGSDRVEIVGRLTILTGSVPSPAAGPTSIPIDDGLELDLAARALWRDHQAVRMRPREFELLEVLATHPRRIFSRNELLGLLWKSSTRPRAVDVHICKLRSKVEVDPDHPVRIVTLQGSGYRFDPPPEGLAGISVAANR